MATAVTQLAQSQKDRILHFRLLAFRSFSAVDF